MSEFEERIQLPSAEQEVDLLVDGELGESARRSLLLRLEHEPDGWRRCALAFLEAQCWKTELGEMAAKAGDAAAATPPVPASQPAAEMRVRGWRQHAATGLAMAGSFLIALVAGMGLRGNWSTVSTTPHGGPGLMTLQPAIETAHPASLDAGQAGQWTTVTVDPAGSGNGLRVPALQCNSLNEQLLTEMPSVISPELQRALEQSQYRIDQQREIVPVQMKDGRRLVVPVDHIQIHYVGGRPSL